MTQARTGSGFPSKIFLHLLAMRALLLMLLSINSCSVASPCTRFNPGEFAREPAQVSSTLGFLDIRMEYSAGLGSDGNIQYCYLTQDGIESPTLLLWPGDRLRLTLTNLVYNQSYSGPIAAAAAAANYATNIHFHGLSVSPAPGKDFSMTLILPGATFTYDIDIPIDHPVGVHW
jgi:FtsP/CotA-like multicopper oxidase with cupredoxin domain